MCRWWKRESEEKEKQRHLSLPCLYTRPRDREKDWKESLSYNICYPHSYLSMYLCLYTSTIYTSFYPPHFLSMYIHAKRRRMNERRFYLRDGKWRGDIVVLLLFLLSSFSLFISFCLSYMKRWPWPVGSPLDHLHLLRLSLLFVLFHSESPSSLWSLLFLHLRLVSFLVLVSFFFHIHLRLYRQLLSLLRHCQVQQCMHQEERGEIEERRRRS